MRRGGAGEGSKLKNGKKEIDFKKYHKIIFQILRLNFFL